MNIHPYSGTEVSVEKSQGDIKKLLQKYGCSAVQTAEDMHKGLVVIRFCRLIEGSDKAVWIRFTVQIPKVEEPTRVRYGSSKEKIMRERLDQAERQAWRALYYALKSRMESVVFGIETFEEAFLAHAEIVTRDGQKMTFGEWAIPGMKSGQLQLPARTEA